jgi:alkylation response protein AidB-like acyl-CoA dehydrogenase
MEAIGPSDDQRRLAESASAALAAHSPLALTRAAYDDPIAADGLWSTIVDLGWTGVISAGDADSDEVLNCVVLLEAAGHAVVAAPLLSTLGLAAGALRSCRAEAAGLLDEIAGGATAALLVSVDGSRLPAPSLTLSRGRLSGRVDQARDIGRAAVIVALAAAEDGTTYLTAFRSGSGIEITELDGVDPSQPVASVTVDVSPELCVQAEAVSVLAVPLVAAAAELVGVADRAVAMSVAHAKTRHQFGQPIGGFQAVKHRLADAYVGVERARSLTYAAASHCAGDDSRAAWRAALLAKAAANDAATNATRAAVAVHGAIAQTWEHDAHLLIRRAWQSSALMGESAALYAAAARDYVQRVAG